METLHFEDAKKHAFLNDKLKFTTLSIIKLIFHGMTGEEIEICCSFYS